MCSVPKHLRKMLNFWNKITTLSIYGFLLNFSLLSTSLLLSLYVNTLLLTVKAGDGDGDGVCAKWLGIYVYMY